MKCPRLKSILALSAVVVTALSSSAKAQSLPSDGGMPPVSLILPMMYSQNVMIKFILGSYGKTDAEKIQSVKDAETAIEKFAKQSRYIHRVDSIQELDHAKAILFPKFYSLEDELEYRRTQDAPPFLLVSSGNSDVNDHVEQLWIKQEQRLEAFAKFPTAMSVGLATMSPNRIIREMLDNTQKASLARALVTDQQRLDFANRMHVEVQKGIHQIDTTGTSITGNGSLQQADPAMKRFFELAIGEYFKNLDMKEKINITSTFLDNPDLSSPREKFELMVMNSGPQFQKLFQVYARMEGFSEDMKQIFKKLESTARPAPFRLVKQMIDAEPVPFQWVSIKEKALGVGTMAQVHRAQIRLSNGEVKEVVVRVMKPKIRERLEADNAVLRKMAPLVDADPTLIAARFPQITPFVEEIIGMGVSELNVPATVAAQKRGALIYNKDTVMTVNGKPVNVRFHVPAVYDVSPTSSMMVQEFVPGISFEEFSRQAPDVALSAVEELSKHWLEQTLLGSGFYHSDLHQGNLRVTRLNNMVQVNILDFGMTGQLTPQMQRQIIAISAIVKSERADLIAKALWEISVQNENKITLPQLTILIQNEIQLIARTGVPFYDMGGWVGTAASGGIKFPADFTSLNRGMTLITQMLLNSKSKLTVADFIVTPLLKSPSRMRDVTNSLRSISKSDWIKIALANAGIRRESAPIMTPVNAPAPQAMSSRACLELFRH